MENNVSLKEDIPLCFAEGVCFRLMIFKKSSKEMSTPYYSWRKTSCVPEILIENHEITLNKPYMDISMISKFITNWTGLIYCLVSRSII